MIEFAPIPDTEVVSLVSEQGGQGVIARLRSTAEAPLTCPYCGAERIRNGTRLVTFCDVPQNDRPMRIEWRRQNFRCPRCLRSSHDNHPAFDQRHAVTRRFVEWVSSEGRKVTFMSLSKLSGVNEKVIRQIFAKQDEVAAQPGRTEMLGLELIRVAGSLYPALIDIQNGTIIDVYSSTNALLAELALSTLGDGTLLSAETVVFDFDLADDLQSYVSSATATIISRTSLHRVALATIESQVSTFFAQLRENGKQRSAPDLALFRKRYQSLGQTSRKRLHRWEADCSPLYKVYRLKENFLDHWSFIQNPSEDEWRRWKERAVDIGLDLGSFIDRIDSNWSVLTAYTRHPVLRHSYPSVLTKAQQIDKGATHSFSASRAILLASQHRPA